LIAPPSNDAIPVTTAAAVRGVNSQGG